MFFFTIDIACICYSPNIKGARSDCFRFFSNFRRCGIRRKLIFFITSGEFYSWKKYRLEVINENVTSYAFMKIFTHPGIFKAE